MSKIQKTPNWKLAEQKLAKAVGGTLTPGSGNKNVKGDVRLRKEGWMFEAKSTERDTYQLRKDTLTKLEIHTDSVDACLVIFFGLRGTPYYFVKKEHQESTDWSTVTVTEDTLPDFLYTENGVWEKDTWDSLYDLK